MLAAVVDVIRGGLNQYPPGGGDAGLARAASRRISRGSYGLSSDPAAEDLLITFGADRGDRGGMCWRWCDPGDEVIALEPFL